MKKLLTILCSMTLVVGMGVTAFAAPSMPGTGTNEDTTLSDTDGDTELPVYGYIGPDAEIKPDPDDPTGPPIIDPVGTDISLSVPINLMWASFASGSGNITSPNYRIKNNSAFAVDVELTSFTQTSAANAKDSQITLTLPGLVSAGSVVGAANLTVGTLDAKDRANDAKSFTIGGRYSGNHGSAYKPEYEMVLTFAIAG